ncbi:hypothetical protein HK101_008271 [Irineochytrium annulatum]|nr:hypothetical protein HK101_008271 [Irineochytrium annulatum]
MERIITGVGAGAAGTGKYSTPVHHELPDNPIRGARPRLTERARIWIKLRNAIHPAGVPWEIYPIALATAGCVGFGVFSMYKKLRDDPDVRVVKKQGYTTEPWEHRLHRLESGLEERGGNTTEHDL